MNKGHSAAWDQNWSQAAGLYRQAIDEFPNHPMALNSLGLALFEMKDYEQALQCYEQAARYAPDDPLPYEKMARIYEQLGKQGRAVQLCMKTAELHLKGHNVEKAIENWRQTAILQPEHLAARTRLAMVYERMNRKNEAAAEYLASASILQQSGDLAKSMQVVAYVQQMLPDSPEAKQAIQRLRNNQALPRPARLRPAAVQERTDAPLLAAAKEEKSIDPVGETRQRAMADLAGLLFDQAEENGNGETGRRGLAALTRGAGTGPLGHSDRTRLLMHLGQAIESQSHGDDNQAAAELERAMDLGLSHPAADFNIGLMQSQRNPQRALRALQRSAKHPDFALGSYVLLAGIYENSEDNEKAATAYLQALRLADAATVPVEHSDELAQLYEPIIEGQTRIKDDQQLKRLCKTISEQLMRPDWRTYLQTARREMPAQPENGLPVPLAEMLLETNSSQVVEALGRVRALVDQRKYRTAMEEVYNALQVSPTYLPLHIQIGDILLRNGQTQEAVTKFMLVAELYSLRGEAAQAMRLLERVVQMTPMELKVRSRLIDLMVAQGRLEDAIQQYMDLAMVYYHLAELNMARQTYASALRLAQQAKVEPSWTVELLYKLSDIDLQRLDLRQAVRIFEQIRTMEPEDIRARRSIIDLYFRLGQDVAALSEVDGFTALLEHSGQRNTAIEFLSDLTAERPESLELNKRLADLYVRDGKILLAVERLDMIADSLLNAGNREGAMAMLKAIIALKPVNVKDYQSALMKLQRA